MTKHFTSYIIEAKNRECNAMNGENKRFNIFIIFHNRSRLYCKPSDINCTSLNPLQLNSLLEPMIKEAHFVICFLRPKPALFSDPGRHKLTMPEIVRTVSQTVIETRNALERVNPNTGLIVETGWPSEGWSRNGSPNSIKNMKEYWVLMTEWAKFSGFEIFMFEAFDEPWKIDLLLQGRNESAGICGSEDHYGRWRRKDNSDPGTYIGKLEFNEDIDNSNYAVLDASHFPEYCPKGRYQI